MIRERTRLGLAAARARGRLGGRPPALTPQKLAKARAMRAQRTTMPAIAEELGVSVATLYRHLAVNDDGEVWRRRLSAGSPRRGTSMRDEMPNDQDQALALVGAGDRRWAGAMKALEGSVARIREFGEAAKEEATALRWAEARSVRWSPRPGASRMQLPYDLRAESGLRDPRAPWDALDDAWAKLGEALEGDELFLRLRG